MSKPEISLSETTYASSTHWANAGGLRRSCDRGQGDRRDRRVELRGEDDEPGRDDEAPGVTPGVYRHLPNYIACVLQ
jgi:hypothetical protein